MAIGVPSGASRRSRRRDAVGDANAAVRNRLPEQLGLVRAVDPDDVRRPVGDPSVGARLERERPVERIRRHERGLDVEVAPERRRRARGARPPRCVARSSLPSRTRRTSSRAGAEPDDDPVHHRTHLDRVRANPAAGAVRSARQAQPVPELPVPAAAGCQGEHDLELVVGPEPLHPAHDRSGGRRRRADGDRLRQLAGRRERRPGRGWAAGRRGSRREHRHERDRCDGCERPTGHRRTIASAGQPPCRGSPGGRSRRGGAVAATYRRPPTVPSLPG